MTLKQLKVSITSPSFAVTESIHSNADTFENVVLGSNNVPFTAEMRDEFSITFNIRSGKHYNSFFD